MKRNTLGLILALILCLCSSSTIYAQSYNYPGYSGNLPVESEEEYNQQYTDWISRKIIDMDDRYTVKNPHVYPYSAVCLVEQIVNNRTVGWGTGFLISPNRVATAAHCLTYEKEIIDRVILHFGCNGPNCSNCIYDVGVAKANFNLYPSYIVSAGVSDPNNKYNDIAYIDLGNRDLSDTCGYFGINDTYGSMLGKNVRISGYPEPNINNFRTLRSIGQVTGWSNSLMEYNNDTQAGDSGAPIYTRNSRGNYIAVGINTGHPNDLYLKYNYGTPLTVQWSPFFLLGSNSGGGGFEPVDPGGFEPVDPGGFEPEDPGGFEPVDP